MFEITTNQRKDFLAFKGTGKAYCDGIYDFTFEDRYHIYHCKTGKELNYIALDKTTGYGSAMSHVKRVIEKSQFKMLVPDILYSIKYTGDKRYMGEYRINPLDFIDMIFRFVMPQYGYTIREEQIKMSKQMFKGLTGKSVTLCEAEVGTGKTMAYLVAAFTASRYDERYRNMNRPITISTSSIELQHMIIQKEIPDLSKMITEYGLSAFPFKAVLRKGKEHYFCPQRYDDYMKSICKYPDKYSETIKVLDRLNLLNDGFDLDSIPGLASWLKSKICVKGTCRNCPHRDCKYYRYISDANNLGSYDIQVTNHNLLMTSQMLKKGNDGDSILQKSNFCIIDEAHKLRETASTVFGAEIESDAVSNYFYSIKYDFDQDKSCSAVLRNCCNRTEQLNNELFRLVTLSGCDTTTEDEPDRINFTYSEELRDVLNDLIHTLKRICQIVKDIPKYKSLQCNNLIASFEKFLVPEDILYWVDIDKASNTTSLCCEPKSLENNMRECLWCEPDVHYVLTSGTMKDDRGFEYFKNEIGLGNCLPSFKQSECSCDSPFDYSKHTRLYISENVGYPDNDEDGYINDLVDEIEKLIQATHGHTAILFTSYKVLSTVYDRIAPRLKEYPLLRMSKSNKNAISDFKKSKNGILFASGSMWEGVDCIGDILSSVIIVKLPFPLRTRVLEQKKKDCATMHEFIHTYAVPQMLIKLRQGAGRLIRCETDTGVLSILDARASRTGSYKRRVLSALSKYPLANSIEEVAQFLADVKPSDYFKN